MALKSIDPTGTPSWNLLNTHYEEIKNAHMKEWFAQNKNRANDLTIRWEDFYIDFSKHRITDKTLRFHDTTKYYGHQCNDGQNGQST